MVEVKKELDQAMANGDAKAFEYAKFKLRQLEIATERDEEIIHRQGKYSDVKKSEEINRRMLKAIDAKLAILNNL